MNALSLAKFRRLQKNARNKESRLRRQGALESQIKSVSPVLEWSEVEKLSPQQLGWYGRRLQQFTSRSNRLDVLASREIIPHATITESKKLTYKINSRIRRANEKLKKQFGNTVDLYEEIKIREKPASKAWAQQRIKNLTRRSKHDVNYYLDIQRKNIKVQLTALGYEQYISSIDAMSNNQLQWLVMNKMQNIWDMLNGWYRPNETKLTETMQEKQSRQDVDPDRGARIGQYIEAALKIRKFIKK